jgi:hypothetical protein
MSRPLSRYLKDFGAEPSAPAPMPAAVVSSMPSMPFENTMSFAEPDEVQMVDIAAERREAYAEGHEAATLALTELHQQELDAVKVAHEAELEQLKAKFETEAVERIAYDLQQIATAIGLSVSSEAAKALSPIMTDILTDKAIDELAALVTAAVLDGTVGPIAVSGRRVMFERLASRADPDGVLLAHVEAEDVDLSVTIGDSVLVTRMSAWADGLKEVLS